MREADSGIIAMTIGRRTDNQDFCTCELGVTGLTDESEKYKTCIIPNIVVDGGKL